MTSSTKPEVRHSGAHLSAATCRTTRATAADNANGKYATLSTRVSEICAQTDRYVDRNIGSRFVEVDCRNVLTFTTRNRICLCEMQLTPAQRDLPLISHKGCSAAMRPFAKFLRTLLDFRNKCTGPRTTGTRRIRWPRAGFSPPQYPYQRRGRFSHADFPKRNRQTYRHHTDALHFLQ